MRVDDSGLIADFTVVIRPIAGLAAVAQALAPYVARSRLTALLLRVLAAPLVVVLNLSERLIPRLIRMR